MLFKPVAIVTLIAMLLIEFFGKYHSIFLLITFFAGLLLIVVGSVFNLNDKVLVGEIARPFKILQIVVMFGFVGFSVFTQYQKDERFAQEVQFSKRYNQYRRRIGIPLIPDDWQAGNVADGILNWHGTQLLIGHTKKRVYFRSPFNIESETDWFDFKSLPHAKRFLKIYTYFGNGKGVDSVTYNFQDGVQFRSITKQQADSVFAAEKIIE